ncbi:HEPN domain-containing protein [bacterium]|nr:HEPN domain-containing protein [bacterium]
MRSQHIELSTQWLKKAGHDLITAHQTLLLPDGPTDTVAFHAQQAVEKSLKAFLTLRQIEFPKSHELVRLLDMAVPLLSELDQFRQACAELSDYAVEIRYPTESLEPSRAEAVSAVDMAEEIVKTIQDHMP